jgi:aspartyl-tRNA(Asn)/glutamyl-tRNA(Gln) amidotransferase subunit A
MVVDLAFLTIAEASALIKSRQLSPVEYVEALIRRTETFDAQQHAYITPTFDLARQQAKQAERDIAAGTYRGPLHGIPFALKDIYDTQGIRTSGHSKVCLQRLPVADATATRKLCEAGAILMGKLATHEFAHGGPSFDLPWPPPTVRGIWRILPAAPRVAPGRPWPQDWGRWRWAPILAARSAVRPHCVVWLA